VSSSSGQIALTRYLSILAKLQRATLRHTAALALVGWYLIAAPMETTPASPSQWRIAGTYDNASDCQQKLETPSRALKSGSPSSRAINMSRTPGLGCVAMGRPPSKGKSANSDPRLGSVRQGLSRRSLVFVVNLEPRSEKIT
jgi:hypothetical protein